MFATTRNLRARVVLLLSLTWTLGACKKDPCADGYERNDDGECELTDTSWTIGEVEICEDPLNSSHYVDTS